MNGGVARADPHGTAGEEPADAHSDGRRENRERVGGRCGIAPVARAVESESQLRVPFESIGGLCASDSM